MSDLWLHPALILIVGGLLLPLLPARLRSGWAIEEEIEDPRGGRRGRAHRETRRKACAATPVLR